MNVVFGLRFQQKNLQNLDATKLRARCDLGKNSFESKEQLSPFFEYFLFLAGRGTRQKKLQN
jgi:hypothetical protein